MAVSTAAAGPRYGRTMTKRVRVAILYGGRSSEHSISCVSAGSLLRAIDPEVYDAVAVGIARDGQWYLTGADPESLVIRDGELPEVTGGAPVALASTSDGAQFVSLDGSRAPVPVDVVFPVLHGPWGEDGTVQGVLESVRVPYVGSGVFASAAGMDKGRMKAVFADADLPIGPYVAFGADRWRADPVGVRRQVLELGLPLFVKPARAGSSLGISKVSDAGALDAAIAGALEHDPRVVVELGLLGAREIECAVLADAAGVPRASICAEIIVRGPHEFYDFEAKYLDDSADLVVPADLPGAVHERIGRLAIRAFESIGCEGLARVDFFLLPDGRTLVNELNTMPGFTAISMFPRMWAHEGVAYPDLVDRLLRDALRRGVGLR